MATNRLSISSLINVGVILTPTAAQAQNLSTLLALSNTNNIDSIERYRVYSSSSQVAAEFGAGSDTHNGAVAWFSQSPQPRELIVGLWGRTAKKGGLRCAPLTPAQQNIANWTSITTGAFALTVDGGAAVQITGLNFSTVTNMSDVAAIVTAGMTTATCAWNPAFQRFEFYSNSSGATSSVAFLAAPAAGSPIQDDLKGRSTDAPAAYSYTGLDAESPASVLALFEDLIGQKWYALAALGGSISDSVHQNFAAGIESLSNKHLYVATTSDAACTLAASTTDLAAVLKAAGYKRTFLQYSTSGFNAAISGIARLLTVNYAASNTAITLMYKQQPGVTAENLSASQAAALKGKNCNVFAAYDNDTNILQHGTMVDGTFADIVAGTDWLALTIQTELWNLLYTSPTKIPQTDAGVNVLVAKTEAICSQAVTNGLCAPGVWNSAGFGAISQGDYLAKGFYVYAQRVDAQTLADRGARKAPPIQVAAKLAGAIHSVDVQITVNQ